MSCVGEKEGSVFDKNFIVMSCFQKTFFMTYGILEWCRSTGCRPYIYVDIGLLRRKLFTCQFCKSFFIARLPRAVTSLLQNIIEKQSF